MPKNSGSCIPMSKKGPGGPKLSQVNVCVLQPEAVQGHIVPALSPPENTILSVPWGKCMSPQGAAGLWGMDPVLYQCLFAPHPPPSTTYSFWDVPCHDGDTGTAHAGVLGLSPSTQ